MELTTLSLGELQKLKAQIEKQIGNREKQQRDKAMDEIKSIAAKYGLKLADVVVETATARPSVGRKSAAKKTAVKKQVAPSEKKVLYRHPENPELTWGGGRGRRPQWIKDWEATGQTLDEIRVG